MLLSTLATLGDLDLKFPYFYPVYIEILLTFFLVPDFISPPRELKEPPSIEENCLYRTGDSLLILSDSQIKLSVSPIWLSICLFITTEGKSINYYYCYYYFYINLEVSIIS